MKVVFTLFACFLLYTVQAQVTGDYCSAGSGNWSNSSSWERFNGTSWVAATAPPTSTDGIISIRTGHNITIAAAVTADQVVVDAGGTLTMNSNLTLDNGTGDDLTMNGTMIWNNSTLGGAGNAVVAAAGNLNLATTGSKFISAPITIHGTMDWQDGYIYFNATITLTNNGKITISSSDYSISNNAGTGTLQNNGTITKT